MCGMPKARRSKKATKTGAAQSRVTRASQNTAVAQRERGAAIPASAPTAAPGSAQAAGMNRRIVSPRVAGPQSLVFPAMVALGCWGMAFTLAYFYTDPNRFIFAGIAVLMALLWTYSVVVRIRKLRALRQTK